MKKLTFEAWYKQLKALAKKADCSFLIAEAESHRSAYDDGLTPREELEEQIDAARRSV